jgi:hypothetical protein
MLGRLVLELAAKCDPGGDGRNAVRSVPPPATLDYELWLGPAPEAPYQPERVHYRNPVFGWRLLEE